VKRGEIWTASGGANYAGKPRPVLIVQSDDFDTDSITTCGLTSDPVGAQQFRLPVVPSSQNGLQVRSMVMIDKVTTMPRTKLGKRVGVLTALDMTHVNRAMLVFLGLAGGSR
jgi:mRNA interferase MazF